MNTPESSQYSGYDLVSSLYEVEGLQLNEAVEAIKRAEYYAPDNDGLCWVLIARTWFDLSNRCAIGLQNVRRCLLIAETLPNFTDGLVEGVDLWFELVKDDPNEIDMARRWMSVMEKDLASSPNPVDACACARTWARFPDAGDRRNAWRLLDYASQLYEKEVGYPNPYPDMIDKGRVLSEFRKAIRDTQQYFVDNEV